MEILDYIATVAVAAIEQASVKAVSCNITNSSLSTIVSEVMFRVYVLYNIGGSTVFSSMDLVKVNQQITVEPDDVCQTPFITPFGQYEFPFTTFGLRNSRQTLQHFINHVVAGLDFCFAYVYDIFA